MCYRESGSSLCIQYCTEVKRYSPRQVCASLVRKVHEFGLEGSSEIRFEKVQC